ncbi:unnamed protein product [Coffea canephora]|uniref:DH200=94 genomic scaffold, scaffold_299 n=1 Tax=Coffea canephora TaxID=49390 RepID=A0A068VDG5_COFCA|nr:unnamed protein product [Coffea canephora]
MANGQYTVGISFVSFFSFIFFPFLPINTSFRQGALFFPLFFHFSLLFVSLSFPPCSSPLRQSRRPSDPFLAGISDSLLFCLAPFECRALFGLKV